LEEEPLLNEPKSSTPVVWLKAGVWTGFATSCLLGLFLITPLLWRNSNSGTANFLVVGDWGRNGSYNQSEVADAMAAQAAKIKAAFVIGTGDNFYQSGLACEDDEYFDTSFRQVYSAKSLQVPWYNVLGNHDYGEYDEQTKQPPSDRCKNATNDACFWSPLHQLGAAVMNKDPRWYLERSYERSIAGGQAEVFFYDTVPFVQHYKDQPWYNAPGGLAEQSWEANLLELEAKLARSKAPWKIVVGHHPVYTNGHHGNTVELVEHLQPLLQKYNVQVYFCGHDHNLEYIKKPDEITHHFISGGGSKSGRAFIGDTDSQFQWVSSGFASVQLQPDAMTVSFFGIEGDTSQPLYTAAVPR
jgi:tartrate-resistant acid phosphatase type 5